MRICIESKRKQNGEIIKKFGRGQYEEDEIHVTRVTLTINEPTQDGASAKAKN